METSEDQWIWAFIDNQTVHVLRQFWQPLVAFLRRKAVLQWLVPATIENANISESIMQGNCGW
jgi:hypothetical protein